jgi:Putative Na+/H+ antiporter
LPLDRRFPKWNKPTTIRLGPRCCQCRHGWSRYILRSWRGPSSTRTIQLFVGGFLFFLGFARATAPYQSRIELKTPLLVGFFLAGLVIHGGLQGWWIAPVLSRLPESPLFLGATALTAVNDNALITYLATLAPNLSDELKLSVVQGAVVGGGLTVIANAPNPAGQALLGRFFDGAILPLGLLAGALLPTVIAAIVFRLL